MSSYNKSNHYSRLYSDFSGVDLSCSASNIHQNRLSDVKNMYRDYYGSDGSAVETVPGFRRLYSFSSSAEERQIHALCRFSPYWSDKEYIAVHAGKRLFLYPVENKDAEDCPVLAPVKLYRDGQALDAAALSDQKSVMQEFDGVLYILDGENYFALDELGLRNVSDITYIPTTYSDGMPYEQKNMLTDDFYCRFNLSPSIQTVNRYQYTSEGIIYSITGDGVCEAAGISDRDVKELFIPSQTEIDGQIYYVEAIGSLAFRDLKSLTRVVVMDGVKRVGENAFLMCSALESVTLPDSVEELGMGAFLLCESLTTVTMGAKIKSIPRNAFYDTALSNVIYSGNEESWSTISKDTQNPDFYELNVTYDTINKYGVFRFYINERCKEIYSITLGDEKLSEAKSSLYYTQTYEKDGENIIITDITVHTTDYTQLNGKVLTIYGKAATSDEKKTLKRFCTQKNESGYDVISACTLCVDFDGRTFYSGNPNYPSAVFYSARDNTGEISPLYIGSQNYFYAGREDARVTCMLASGNNLIVFKDDNERGGIYIYEGKDTDSDLIPRIYALSEYVGGVGSVGKACSFYGDTVFLSERGVDAISKKQLNAETSICHRSSNIDPALLRGSLDDCDICCWQGYLCVLRDGEIYLADSRRTFSHLTGDTQYEWFSLSDIGTYEEQYNRYFTIPLTNYYSDLYIKHGSSYIPLEGRDESTDDCDEVIMTYAYKFEDGDFKEAGIRIFYSLIPDESGIFHCYMCDTSGEMKGGVYSPACRLLCLDDVLYFGTKSGVLCCFNTDKRDADGNIDRRYYTFDGRRYFSCFSTKSDDCGIPSFTKSTVKHSLCMHMKGFGGGRVKVAARTDQGSWHEIGDEQNGLFSFDDVEFDRFTFNTSRRISVIMPEKEKRWTEKQYHVYSDEYMRPFGIFDISYRYKVAGRIKNK